MNTSEEYELQDSAEIRELTANIEVLKNTCSHLRQRLTSSNNQINDLTAELDNARRFMSKEIEQEIKKIASKYEHEEISLIRQKEALQKNIEIEKEEVKALDEKCIKLKKQIQEHKQCNEEKETQSDNIYLREAHLQHELDSLEDEKISLDKKKKNLEEKLEKMDSLKTEIVDKKEHFDSKLTAKNEQIAQLKTEIEEKEEELEELKAALAMKTKSDMVPEGKSLFSEVDDERLDVEKQLSSLIDRHKFLKEEETKRLHELQRLTFFCNKLDTTKENAVKEYKAEVKKLTITNKAMSEGVQNKIKELQKQMEFLPEDSAARNCPQFPHLEAMIIKEVEEEGTFHCRLLEEKFKRSDLFEKIYQTQEDILKAEKELFEIRKENVILKIEIIKLGGPSL